MYSDSIAGQFAQSIRYFIGYLSKRVPVKLCAEVCFASPMSDVRCPIMLKASLRCLIFNKNLRRPYGIYADSY